MTWHACTLVLPICLLPAFSLCSSSSLPIKYWGSDLWFLVFSVFTQFLDNVIAFIGHLFSLTCRFILRPPLFWPPCLCIRGLCCLWRATKSLTNVSWSSSHAVHLHSAAFYVGQHDPANPGQQPWSHPYLFTLSHTSYAVQEQKHGVLRSHDHFSVLLSATMVLA